jgi:lysophospholipase L1-like esterase
MKLRLLALACIGIVCGAQDLERAKRLLFDWGGLTRYGSENTELRTPPDVVFLGDDVTERWDAFFPGKPYLNRGVSGQTTPQMLVRFRQDVIDLKPRVVVIQATSNDLAGFAGPITEKMSVDYIRSMTELAKVHGIRVVLASVTPVCDCFGKVTAQRPPGRILGLNSELKAYAAETGTVYLDLYSALGQGRNMKREFTADGFLPNPDGYAKMTPLAEKAIAEARK